MKIIQLLVLGLFFSSNAIAWEAYDFDVSFIQSSMNGSCTIGMKNLGPKMTWADDPNICDNPSAIIIADCSTESAKQMLSLAMSAELSGRRVAHLAIADAPWFGCAVAGNALTLYPQAIGLDPDELPPMFDQKNAP